MLISSFLSAGLFQELSWLRQNGYFRVNNDAEASDSVVTNLTQAFVSRFRHNNKVY